MTRAVLVTGATGTVGRALVSELLAAGELVQAGVVDPVAVELPPGAQPVRLDFRDPSTAAPALVGVDRLFLLRPPAISHVATALGPLVRAAAEAGVRRVVVLSVMGVNPALPHWRMERMVRRAGLSMTALRPAYFAQNLLTAFGRELREHSRLRLACGSGQVSFVDTHDVAAAGAGRRSGVRPGAARDRRDDTARPREEGDQRCPGRAGPAGRPAGLVRARPPRQLGVGRPGWRAQAVAIAFRTCSRAARRANHTAATTPMTSARARKSSSARQGTFGTVPARGR